MNSAKIKNKKTNLFLKFILICLIIQNCHGAYIKELSGEYFYRDEASDVKDIINHLPNRKNIYSTILKYNFNKDFIIAYQQPNYVEYIDAIAFELRDNTIKYPPYSKDEITSSEKAADSILKHDPYYVKIFSHKFNYWIISNKDTQVYGPLTKQEYFQKRLELKIPNNLKLKNS